MSTLNHSPTSEMDDQSSSVSSSSEDRFFFSGRAKGNLSRLPESIWRRYYVDQLIHRRLLYSYDSSFNPQPIVYLRSDSDSAPSQNATNSATAAAPKAFYRQIEDHLCELRNDNDDHQSVEKGAIDTAITVLRELELNNHAPPMVTVQSPDAVVMLWSLGGTTYAITITDGELGYVVRKDRKRVKLVDSLKVETFKLIDLTRAF